MTPAADAPQMQLPPFRQQLGAELRRQFKRPFEELQVIAFNCALLLGGWFLLSPATVSRYTSLIFLPAALASWAFADVPATNLYGAEPSAALKRFDDRPAMLRLFSVKNVALWVIISPACFLLAIMLAPSQDSWTLSFAVAVAVMSMPFAYLGVCSLVAPLLPFHRMPLRQRWHRRDTWLRFGVGAVIPYVLTTPAALIALAPLALIVLIFGDEPTNYLAAAVLMTPWCFLVWRLGLRLSWKITQRRKVWLTTFLLDPSRG